MISFSKFFTLLFLLSFSSGFFACKGVEKTQKDEETTEDTTDPKPDSLAAPVPLISMTTGACRGQCPVYTLTIYDNRFMVYEGKRFTDKMGLYSKRLDPTELTELISAFRAAKFMEFQDFYETKVADIPSVSISFTDNGKSKTVIGSHGRPESLMALQNRLSALAQSENWNKATGPKVDTPKDTGPKEIIVQLIDDITYEEWVEKYAGYGITKIKQISPNLNYYLVSYDISRLNPEEMIRYFRADEEVMDAQFNEAVEDRD